MFPKVRFVSCPAGVLIGGDDFKSGQTKMKSVLVDFLVGAGIKPTSIVSYNHLGNNDGMNLSAPQTFRSKEISKSNVVSIPQLSQPLSYDLHCGAWHLLLCDMTWSRFSTLSYAPSAPHVWRKSSGDMRHCTL